MLVRLPSRMHVPTVELPRLSSLPLPPLSLSSTSILLALLASLVLLATGRAVLLFIRPKTPLSGKPASVSVVSVSVSEKPALPSSPSPTTPAPKKKSSWGWGLLKWDSLPSLPVSLSAASIRCEMRGRGVGLRSGTLPALSQQQQQQMQQIQSWQRRGPAFERPLPAIYQSDVPASMAKMIMSRHTFRRPTSRPPPRTSVTPQVQIQKRSPSMV